MDPTTQWHLDRRVPIALIMAIGVQTVGIVWWAATISSRVEVLEQRLASTADQRDRIIRLEVNQENQTAILKRIEEKLDKQVR